MLRCNCFDRRPCRSFFPAWQKDHSQGEAFRKIDALAGGTFAQKVFGNGGEHSGAVTAAAVGIHTSAMRQAAQSFERALDDLMRPGAAELGDETHSAGVVVWRKPTRGHISLV